MFPQRRRRAATGTRPPRASRNDKLCRHHASLGGRVYASAGRRERPQLASEWRQGLGCPMREIVNDRTVSPRAGRFGQVDPRNPAPPAIRLTAIGPPSAEIGLELAQCSGRRRLVRGRHHPSFDFHRDSLTQEGHFNDQSIWLPMRMTTPLSPVNGPAIMSTGRPRTSSSDRPTTTSESSTRCTRRRSNQSRC